MNTMNMPGFTAEDSLYKTSGHYQTGRHAINSSTQMISAIYPAVIQIGEETIEVVGTAPMELPWGWGPGGWNWGGGGGGGFGDGGGGGGGGGGGSGGTGLPPGRRPVRPKTLGLGPKYSKIRDSFTCHNAGVDAAICHSCSRTAAGLQCVCYYCQLSSNECTSFYNDPCP